MEDTQARPTSLDDFTLGDVWKDFRNQWLITSMKPNATAYKLVGHKLGRNGRYGKGAYKLTVQQMETKIGNEPETFLSVARCMVEISAKASEELKALLETTSLRQRQPWQRELLQALGDAKVM